MLKDSFNNNILINNDALLDNSNFPLNTIDWFLYDGNTGT